MGRAALVVTYVSPTPNAVDLIFTHPLNRFVNGGTAFNVGRQRRCDNNGDPYLFLDEYIGMNEDGSIRGRHVIISSKLILTPAGGAPVDLIQNGTYRRCGSTGQPYLKWNFGLHDYRLQAWGYLAESRQSKWYWDALVSAPVLATDRCDHPERHFSAVRVQETWWNNFRSEDTGWSLGHGRMTQDGIPTGEQVTYGRTDWHAAGHMPWAMVVSEDGHAMCATAAQPGTRLPVGQLMIR
jgi:hypothetical protein